MHFFITRTISSTSAFQKLKEKGHQITDLSLLDIEYKPFQAPNGCDLIFFYSPNGIRSFFNSVSYIPEFKYAVMGKGSAQVFQETTNHAADFIGNGTASFCADYLMAHHSQDRICFIKADSSLNQVEKLINTQIKCASIATYRNTKKTSFKLAPFDVLIFTSPMNAEAYFESHGYHNERIFSIGETTAQKVFELIGVASYYCLNPSEEGLYQLVKEHLY